ncbi:MAG: ATP-binding protein [Polyangiaceae bacterium]
MLHLLLGPVGAGKSTYGRQLANEQRALRLTLDDWMARLFGDDPRPEDGRIAWYVERTQRCLGLIWEQTEELSLLGVDVVLELGLIRREERNAYYARVDAAGLELKPYLIDAPRAVRRERVLERNMNRGETFHVEVPPQFFELASDLWEPPDEAELEERGFVVVSRGD